MKTTISMSNRPFKSTKEVPKRNQPAPQDFVDKGLTSVVGDLTVIGKFAFKLKEASVGGKAVIKPAPVDWQQLEEQHVCDRVLAQKARRRKPLTH